MCNFTTIIIEFMPIMLYSNICLSVEAGNSVVTCLTWNILPILVFTSQIAFVQSLR
jgi:hypothetical protein